MFGASQSRIDAAIIGGVGFQYTTPESHACEVNTPYGTVKVKRVSINHHGKKLELALIRRHANNNTGEHLPPHRLNYRANVWAVKAMGARRIIATNSVGTMKDHPPGSFFIPEDFIDLTRSRPHTYFDEETVHVDMTEPYCREIRDGLLKALYHNHMELYSGVYVCTEGPRFETAAEIRMLGSFGDVVGMTGLPEVVLAKELGLCYASICIVTNKASGLAGKKLTADEVLEMLDTKQATLRKVVLDAVASLPPIGKCECRYATRDARVP